MCMWSIAQPRLVASSAPTTHTHTPNTNTQTNTNAGVILGYVGGSHIPAAKKESHAQMLMSGASNEQESKRERGSLAD